MSGRELDCLGAALIGFDYLSLLKGAGGALASFGDKGGGGSKNEGEAIERRRLEDDKRAAERSASRLKLGLGVTAGAAALGVGIYLARKR